MSDKPKPAPKPMHTRPQDDPPGTTYTTNHPLGLPHVLDRAGAVKPKTRGR